MKMLRKAVSKEDVLVKREEAVKVRPEEEDEDDIFLLAKKAREAIYLKRGEADAVKIADKEKRKKDKRRSEDEDEYECRLCLP